ncbi:PREDICTED: abscission/NoCut checkpoint regulator isoform X2 [Dinoponera quadriceps]|nr:PREDICTED: abscission/NoCut checkpoint regulator isoform X2 [Dinoponera quadriceps]XP_014483322.1 PREDICTED: abscission/NoCut checkpoint regulator isoform X2 [Dinoponera quadriceps]XP_014483323.1 PREDICTED: abscission/NoCut checkpoint regulator isoform X2 [Dinoponera quadriceps]XP_014483324.1 PREDICTED: abscission/NoCut checkpoint regulator isoform X2 [Dinoponera quadriceps]
MKKSSPEATTSDISLPNTDKPLAPIDITMKLDSLENPVRPPVVIYKHTNRWDQFKKGLEPADQEIVDRLQKLKNKEQNIPSPSVDEIRRRLALLKDQDPEANGNSNVINIHQVDTRTDQEKTDDLIQEYLAQLELSSTSDSCKEIQEKLNSLRDEDDKTGANQSEREEIDDDEETVTKKLINKALAEAMLEAKYEKEELEDVEPMDSEIQHGSEDGDEKPTCVMCEQTKDLVQCMGCAGDLYCPVCFEDNHDEFEMEKHKATRYRPTEISLDD